MTSLPPGIIILVGALLLPLLPRRAQAAGALLLPALGLAQLLFLAEGVFPGIELAGLSLLPVRVGPPEPCLRLHLSHRRLHRGALRTACTRYNPARCGNVVCRKRDWCGVCR
ncbi:MAG: hypothetical protein CM1200mP20_11200 [Pseudomonadota bacterium]|nr:MAG: hypothetical protein CM1200mP20_11200 [Pseudomonadota bacterium]